MAGINKIHKIVYKIKHIYIYTHMKYILNQAEMRGRRRKMPPQKVVEGRRTKKSGEITKKKRDG